MSTESIAAAPATQELFIQMVVMAWETQNSRVDKILNELSDEKLTAETAPGRNRGIYLLGHLIAVSDGMIPLLGFGEKKYPELEKIFLTLADKSGLEMPSIAELKQYWKDVNATLTNYFLQLPPHDWFTRHNAVSDENFSKEPFRNKLNILINRTNHQSYHLGQLIYLK